jgi:DnaB-like helicase N terminal domain
VHSLSIRAEQAMLGAVLSDPAGQHILDLVEPADMRRPWHGQVLAAMERLRQREVAPCPLEVYRELQNDPDLPSGIARNGVLIADLMEAAPRTRHAGAYAAMVIEGGIRQRMGLAGSRLVQAAASGDLEGALDLAGQARRELDQSRARWLALPERMRRELPVPGRKQQARAETAWRFADVREQIERPHADAPGETGELAEKANVLARGHADTLAVPAGHPEWPALKRACDPGRPRRAAAWAAEVRALRDLAAAPSRLAEVREWLRPEHFSRAGHGELYAVMRDMDAAGKPVDPVTVAWEAARRGVLADPARLAGGTGPFAVASAREVRRNGLLAQAAHAGRGIQADAADPGCPPRQLIEAAAGRLRALESAPVPEPRPGRKAQALAMPAQAAVLARTPEPGREAAQ